MAFAYKTTTVWDYLLPSEVQAEFDSKIELLIAAGKTDNLKGTANWLTDMPATVVRIWATEQDALDWGAFCNTITPPPVSFEVSPNS